MSRPTSCRRRAAIAIGVAAIASAACGDSRAGSADPPPPTGTYLVPGTPATTASPTTSIPVTSTTQVSDAALTRARDAVERFLDAVGTGDVEAARALLGPVSVEQARAAGGVDSLLRTASEGFGAWAAVTDRTVDAIAFGPDVAVVVLEGTLQIEGMSEHRVDAFPVRRAGADGAWSVELWAYDLGGRSPLVVEEPATDGGRARVPADEVLRVQLQAPPRGTVALSLDGAEPQERELDERGRASFAAGAPVRETITVLYRDDDVLDAEAFRVVPAE